MTQKSRYRGLLLLLVILVAVAGALFLRQPILDWYRLRQYTPPSEVADLASKDTLTPYARKIFYVAHPAIEDSTSFNAHCKSHGERTIVLGCYDGSGIYVYNVSNDRLDGVKEVTAAHEMLHAAYDRLSKSEKQQINSELETQLASLHDVHIDQLVSEYKKTEPGQLDNELHSILGTEVGALTPTLEHYYKKYFTDRQTVANYAAKYQSVFTKSEQQIDTIDGQLTDFKGTIEHNEAILQAEQATLSTAQQQMQALRSSGQIDSYNAQVDAFNAQVRSFNTLLATTKQLISQYNQLVAERNSLATAHNNLAQSLNSNISPISTK